MENNHSTEGFTSPEEHMQEYMELFFLMQQAPGEQATEGQLARMCAGLEERERNTDIFIPAIYLRKCYALTGLAYWTMMFAFCCELEDGLCMDYREKCGGHRPDLQYVLQLFSAVLSVDFRDIAELYGKQGRLRDIFERGQEEAGEGRRGFLQCPLRLNPLAFYFLLTGGLPREEWYTVFPTEDEEEMLKKQKFLPLHEKEYGRLCGYLQAERPLRILLQGSRGSGCHTLLQRACMELGINALYVKSGKAFSAPDVSEFCMRQSLHLIVELIKPVVILEPAEELPDTVGVEEWKRMLKVLPADFKDCGMCFLVRTQEQANLAGEYADVEISLSDVLTGEQMRQALDAWLVPEERRQWQEDLLGNYRLNMGELKKMQERIAWLARVQQLSLTDREAWLSGMRGRQEISRLGRLIEDRYGPEEIILPPECRKQLETVIRLAKAWRGGRGLQLLFYGSSGTGKTMAASVLAGQLQLPLFQVSLSQVFDKYIGETEKHIEEIFRMAERNRCLLFFDEADALFAKRTSVKDSHDRYANVSSAYLLQRMEEYDGILILATNLKDCFDDAYVRRIRFAVKFGNLDREGRERLWRKELEGEPPLAQDVDLGKLAEAVELSPARICAAARVAKMLAGCDGSGYVTKSHLLEALELEAGKDETMIKGF